MLRHIFAICFFLSHSSFSAQKKIGPSSSLPNSFVQNPITFSSKKTKEIQNQLKLIVEEYPTQAVLWWSLYKKALLFEKTKQNIFCANMKSLSQIKEFPIRDYASLHFYSNCHEEVKLDPSEFPDWMKQTVALKWNQKSISLGDKNQEMESAYYLYKILRDKNEREKYLLKAIRLAKKQKNASLKKWKVKLLQLSPRYILHPSFAQKLSVAHDARRARDFKKASLYYRQLLNSPHSSFKEKNASFKWMRWIYKDQKNNKKYLVATQQWTRWLNRQMKTKNPKAIKTYHDIAFLLARTQWTLNQPRQALQTLNRLEKELKNRISLFQIYRLKALIFEESKQMEKSIFFFQKSLNEKTADQSLLEKTKWDYAWNLKKIDKIKESLSQFLDLWETSESDYLPSRALFWMAHTFEEEKEITKAKKFYELLIEKDPYSYYGLLAHYKLEKKIKIAAENESFVLSESNEGYIIPHWLISLKENKMALNFLNYKLLQYQKDQNKKVKNWVALFYYMAKAQFYSPLFQTVGNLPVEERNLFFKFYANLLFPIVYEKDVSKAHKLFNIEKEFIYSIIRQESACNPKARSPSDAFGLMQIRPFVAKQISKETGIRYKNIRDLYQPETNILLGTAFLKKLFKRYNFQFVITSAVYNAGGTAVRKWLKQRPNDNPLIFIEEIPYQETKTYVRLLIRNFIFYKLLHQETREMLFPEWLLHIKKLEQSQ